MKRASILDATVALDLHGGSSTSVSWQYPDGTRYHVFVDLPSFNVKEGLRNRRYPVIYKNAPEGMTRGHPGYFPTRYLDATTPSNAATLAHVFAVVRRDGLIKVAEERDAEKQRVRNAERAAEVAAERVREAAPDLLAVLDLFMGEEVHHLVVNGHLLTEADRSACVSDLLRRLPGLYEAGRVALAKARA